ncbi:MAG: hypothetical protein MR355_10220 [Lachnospiraceae bacterium]|nr:hypothetical protein [Lachnospiraceae bacterium]
MSKQLKKIGMTNKKLLIGLLFTLLVAAQLTRIIYVFNQREGFHSDEAWSYGFANSYYDPYIYLNVNDDVSVADASLKNLNEWEPGSKLWDYLVVNKGEKFTYGSVYCNQREDMSPPFHTLILHTICSFFPDSFSWWYAFSINIVAFILTQIVFFALVKTVTGKDWIAFLICGYYGFSYAAVNTFVYLRQYAILTFFTLLLLYLLARMYQKGFGKITGECIASAFVIALGGFTHYYFFVFACFVAAFTCVYLLIHKKWKPLMGYAFFMLLGAGLGILLYPYCLENVLNGVHIYDGNLQLPYYWNLTTCLSLVLNELVGSGWSVNRMTFAWLTVIIPSLALILLAVWFVCRKETWMIDLLQRIRTWLKNWKSNCKRVICGWNPFLIVSFVSAVITIMLIAKISDVETMGALTDRYLFFVMPVVLMALCLLLLYLVRRYLRSKGLQIGVCTVVILGCMVMNQAFSECRWLNFSSGVDESLSELTEDSDVILAGAYAWRLEWYSYELRNVHQFFMTEGENCVCYTDQINSYVPDKGRDVYLILEDTICIPDEEDEGVRQNIYGMDKIEISFTNTGVIDEEEYLDYLQSEINWIDGVEHMYDRDSFCGTLHIYRIHVKE